MSGTTALKIEEGVLFDPNNTKAQYEADENMTIEGNTKVGENNLLVDNQGGYTNFTKNPGTITTYDLHDTRLYFEDEDYDNENKTDVSVEVNDTNVQADYFTQDIMTKVVLNEGIFDTYYSRIGYRDNTTTMEVLNTNDQEFVFPLIKDPLKPSLNSPNNGSTGVELPPTLNLTVEDYNGDNMNVTFYDASDDSQIYQELDVSSGSSVSYEWTDLDTNTEYEWYAVADDGEDTTQSDTWQFETKARYLKDQSLNIVSPNMNYFDVDNKLYFKIYNDSIIKDSNIDCDFALYDHNKVVVSRELNYSDGDYYTNLSNTDRGEYYYDLNCGNNTDYGFDKGNMKISPASSTKGFPKKEKIGLTLGLISTIGLLFFFAYRQDEKHQLLKITTILFGLLGLLILPAAITGSIFTSNALYMRIVYTYFGIFMFYFVVYLVWWLTTSFPEIMRIRR